jgi:hypothetical protein
MKRSEIFFFLLSLCLTAGAQSQALWYGGVPVNNMVNESELIYEGHILSDSSYLQNPPGMVWTYHRVLVLKQFKGNFISDTISVVTTSGRMILNGHLEASGDTYAHKGDEAIFFVSKYQADHPDVLVTMYSMGVGYVTVCNKKDVVKEVYDPIEAVTGQPYVDVHPNTCKPQQK